jgi:hypothetical protein
VRTKPANRGKVQEFNKQRNPTKYRDRLCRSGSQYCSRNIAFTHALLEMGHPGALFKATADKPGKRPTKTYLMPLETCLEMGQSEKRCSSHSQRNRQSIHRTRNRRLRMHSFGRTTYSNKLRNGTDLVGRKYVLLVCPEFRLTLSTICVTPLKKRNGSSLSRRPRAETEIVSWNSYVWKTGWYQRLYRRTFR